MKKHKDIIIEIVLFGSHIQGKGNDIDIAFILNKKPDFSVMKNIEGNFDSSHHITFMEISSIFLGEPVWLSLFHEGISLLSGKHFSSLMNLKSTVLYDYDSSELKNSMKVRFYYALKGRNGNDGIVQRTKSNMIAKGVLIVPVSSDREVREFFTYWQIPFSRKRMLLEE